jgi:hypothetical protein
MGLGGGVLLRSRATPGGRRLTDTGEIFFEFGLAARTGISPLPAGGDADRPLTMVQGL